MTNELFEIGKKAYEVLGTCVSKAIDYDDSEMAIVCGLPLVELARVENASYFGYEGYYNYNTAINLGREALKLAKRKGVPSFLEDDLKRLEKILKERE